MLSIAAPVQAQKRRGSIQGHLTFGSTWFLDEDLPAQATVGGSVRMYVAERVSLEPEFLYMRESESDQDYVFAASADYDLMDSDRRMIPHVMGGLGVFHQNGGLFSRTDLTGIRGAGVKVSLTDRMFFVPRFRMGIEPNFYWQLTGSLGFALTRPAGN